MTQADLNQSLAYEIDAILARHHALLIQDFHEWWRDRERALEERDGRIFPECHPSVRTNSVRTSGFASVVPAATPAKSSSPYYLREHFSTYAEFTEKKKAAAMENHLPRQDRSTFTSIGTNMRRHVKQILEKAPWDYFFTVVILVYIIAMGIEVEYRGCRAQGVATATQTVCNVIFLAELAVRIFAYGGSFFCGREKNWNLLDTGLVLISVVEWTLDGIIGSSTSRGAVNNLGSVRAVRIIRMVRIIRVVRLFKFVRPLRVLVYSILSALKSLVYTCLILLIVMYTFGIIFTSIWDGDRPELAGTSLQDYFGSLTQSLLTLFMCITNGTSWGSVFQSLSDTHWAYGGFFIAYMVFSVFVTMNVMTGLFCQAAIESARKDEEEVIAEQVCNKHMYVKNLKALFASLAENISAGLTLRTFEKHMCDERVEAYFHSLDIKIFDAWTLFKLLDEENSNTIDMDKFIEGCLQLKGPATTIDIKNLQHEIHWFTKHVDKKIANLVDYVRASGQASPAPFAERRPLQWPTGRAGKSRL